MSLSELRVKTPHRNRVLGGIGLQVVLRVRLSLDRAEISVHERRTPNNVVDIDVWLRRTLCWEHALPVDHLAVVDRSKVDKLAYVIAPFLQQISEGHLCPKGASRVRHILTPKAAHISAVLQNVINQSSWISDVVKPRYADDWIIGGNCPLSVARDLEITSFTTDDELTMVENIVRQSAAAESVLLVGDVRATLRILRDRVRSMTLVQLPENPPLMLSYGSKNRTREKTHADCE